MKRTLYQLRNYFKPTDIYTSQRLMLFLLSCLGFFPLRISGRKHNRYLRVSVFGYVMSFIFISFHIGCFSLTFVHWNELLKYNHESLLSKFSGLLKVLNSIILVAVLYGSCLFLPKKISTCMRCIVNIDRKLNLIGVEIDYWKGFFMSILLITGFITTHCLVTFALNLAQIHFVIDSFPDDILPMGTTLITLHVPWVSVTMNCIVSYYVCIIYEIKQRFQGLNKVLEYLINPEITSASVETGTFSIRNKQELYKLVQDLSDLHNDLCDTSEIADEYFATKMLFIIGTVFLIMLLNGYYIFLRLFVTDIGSEVKEAMEVTYFVVSCVALFLGIVFACNAGHSITQENEKTAVYIHKIMNSGYGDLFDQTIKNKLLQFSLQLMHRQKEFSAMGLFSLNRKLIFMISQGVTTYLVILIEFSEDNNMIKKSML